MPLSSASILSGATITPSGGTALAFGSEGIVNNTNLIYATADTDYRTRKEMACTVKKPKPLTTAPNGYSQSRNKIVIRVPLTLANGLVTSQTLLIEQSVDVESTAAVNLELRKLAAQALIDADYTAFWDSSSLA